jgi:TonB-dependent receptor-like protein
LPDGFVNLNSAGLTGLGSATGTGHFVFALNRYTGGDDILWTRGAHSIRVGISVSRFQNNSWNPISENAVWTFTSFANFLAGNALTVNGVVPGPGKTAYRDFRQTDIAPYVQDDWKVTSKLTLNLGLRWQFMTNPTERLNRLYAIQDFATSTGFSNIPNIFRDNPSWNNFGPRIGLAYDPFGDHKTSIRAGFGIFHDPITVQAYQTGFGGAPPWAQSTLNSPLAVYPFAPTLNSPVLPAQTIPWDYRIHSTPYMMQYNFNIQREVARDTVLTLGYVGSHGVHLLTGVEKNPPVPTIDNNGVYHFPNAATIVNGLYVNRVNPHLGNFSPLEPISNSRYNSLQTILNRRFSRSVQTQVAYTWSKCIDNGAFGVGSFNGLGTTPQQVENPFDQRIDKGPCSFDITHVLRVNGLVALPFHGNRIVEGWQISGILSTYSGIPINANTGFDRAQFVSGNTPRPDYAPNNPATSVYPACNNQPILGSYPLWFNPNCYSLEPVGTLGNTGRNTLRGPHFVNADISLSKDTKISEQLRLQFRAEFFNIFNHENFATPNNNIFSGSGAINGSAGRITGSSVGANPRQIQFGLKLNF